MTEQAIELRRPKRGRSPSYPGIDLREALGRARTLYDKERRNAAPVSAIFGHWGYKANTGPGMIALAALKKFGLLVDEGTGPARKARLSEDAVRILLDEREDSIERQRAIQEAALKPAIHAELWGRYGPHLPSNATLEFELQTERGFTKRGMEEFIPQFKSTLAFAELTEGAKLSGEEEDKEPEHPRGTMTFTASTQQRTIHLPISPTEWATLQAPFPLTKEGWDQMLAVLDAMKPALVQPESGAESSREESSE